ncbi:MAG: Mrp/NBP35 family ATP-binding protein [Candidatus Kapabacteria bacterium]|nr:Mrp/NBP35 family ATP-binding protein [Candidatus Kapabacteria bacterium]MCS7170185.1 Mrp/NBP35 family ATP-binding protein [Candidatus Kapabacteria bacterium]MDW8225678.1 Mrp/NBP35 family ATP-binding protein [Bacteroidota bacterium]
MDTIERIRTSIAQVRDPDVAATLSELNAIHDIQLRDGVVKLYLELIPPLQWVARHIDLSCREAIAASVPGVDVHIFVREREIPRTTPSTVLPGVKNLIAIASGKGGVGKSTIAVNLAVAMAQAGATVGLLDADIYGPSAPTLLGLQGMPLHARKDERGHIIGVPHERYGIRVASMGFVLQREQAAILRGPLLAGYFTTLVEQIDWGELDFLIFDLPPGTGDIQLTLAQKVPLTGAVLITTPQELSLADVRRSATMFRRVNVPVLGIVENMSYFVCPTCAHRIPVFGEGGGEALAEEVGAPLLERLPLDPILQRASDEGIPVVEHPTGEHFRALFHTLARALAREIRRRHYHHQSPPMEITL